MSHCAINLTACPNIQGELKEAFIKREVSNFTTVAETGLLQVLRSPFNMDGFLQKSLAPGNGKMRGVELVYSPRISANEVGTHCANVCDSQNEIGDRHQEYHFEEDCLNYDFKVDPVKLSQICKDNRLWLTEKILQAMSAMIRALEIRCALQLPTLIGKFPASENVWDDIKEVCVEKANGDPSSNWLNEIEFTAVGAGYPSMPVVIGWNAIYKAFTETKAACCAASGIDIGSYIKQLGTTVVPSIAVANVLGASHFITMGKGALQLLFFNLYEGMEGMNSFNDSSYVRGVLRDPVFNIPFDYSVTAGCEDLNINLRLTPYLIGMPTDMFCDGDNLSGVTWVNEWDACGPCLSKCYEGGR